MLFELSDICFFVKSFKLRESPDQSFNILNHVSFSQNNTRSGTFNKLVQPPIKLNRDKQFYFNRLPHLWNSLPPIDLNLSFATIRKQLIDIFWKSFLAKFNSAPITSHVPVRGVSPSQNLPSSDVYTQLTITKLIFIITFIIIILYVSGCYNPVTDPVPEIFPLECRF